MFGGRKTQPPQVPPTAPSGTQPQPPVPVARQQIGYETILGPNTTMKGELRSKANVRIDGAFEGSLDSDGNIMVGETARIVADIHAKNEVKIHGAVRGNVNGGKVQVGRTGRVWGDINASSLTTEEGAFIDGKITMVGHPAGVQGFSVALPSPEISVLQPMAEDAVSGEPVEAELLDDDAPRSSSNAANSGTGSSSNANNTGSASGHSSQEDKSGS